MINGNSENMNFFKHLFYSAGILMLISSCSSSSGPNTNDYIISEDKRQSAPDFSLESLSNGTQTLSEYSGKVVYLYFLGYNCPYCIADAPGTQSQVAEKYNSNDVQILGLDLWDGSVSSLTYFRSQTGVNYPLLLKASSIGNAYKAYNDYSVIIDKKGRIAYRGGGVDIARIQGVIDALL